MIKLYWLDSLIITIWVIAILNVRSDIRLGHDSLNYISQGKCFLSDSLICNHVSEPGYGAFIALIMVVNGNIASIVPVVQNLLFLMALVFYVHACFNNGRLNRHMVIRTSLLIALIPTFLIVLNGAIYTESISASLTLIQLGLVTKYVRYFVVGQTDENFAGVISLSHLIPISVLAGTSFLVKGSFLYIQIIFGCFMSAALLFWKVRRMSNIRIVPSFLVTFSLIVSPLVYRYGWSLMHPPELAGSTFGRGGNILFGRTEYAKEFDFQKDSLPFLANALSERGCRYLYGEPCNTYNWYAEFFGRAGSNSRPIGVSDGDLFSRGKRNIMERPVLQFSFMFFEWSRFILHHTTTGFASLELPVIKAWVTSVWFVFVLKIANLAMYAGLFWLIRWREIKSKPEIIIPILFFIAYLLTYGFASTVVRMIYPVAPLLVLVLVDLGLRRWHTV